MGVAILNFDRGPFEDLRWWEVRPLSKPNMPENKMTFVVCQGWLQPWEVLHSSSPPGFHSSHLSRCCVVVATLLSAWRFLVEYTSSLRLLGYQNQAELGSMEVVILGYHGVPMLEPQTYFVLKSMSENMRKKLEQLQWNSPLQTLVEHLMWRWKGATSGGRVVYSWHLRMRTACNFQEKPGWMISCDGLYGVFIFILYAPTHINQIDCLGNRISFSCWATASCKPFWPVCCRES